MKFFSTKDYDRFSVIGGNRDVSQGHVKKLINSIENTNYLEQHPLLVNEKFEIIDGQHRLEAAKKLGTELFYTVIEGADLSDVQRLNSNTKAWSVLDYVKSFIKLGNKDYEYLLAYHDTYGIPLTTSAQILGSPQRDSNTAYGLKIGTFKATKMKDAEIIGERYSEIKKYCKSGTERDRNFIQAFVTFCKQNGNLYSQLLKKLENNTKIIERRVSPREYLRQLEDILNFRNKTEFHHLVV